MGAESSCKNSGLVARPTATVIRPQGEHHPTPCSVGGRQRHIRQRAPRARRASKKLAPNSAVASRMRCAPASMRCNTAHSPSASISGSRTLPKWRSSGRTAVHGQFVEIISWMRATFGAPAQPTPPGHREAVAGSTMSPSSTRNIPTPHRARNQRGGRAQRAKSEQGHRAILQIGHPRNPGRDVFSTSPPCSNQYRRREPSGGTLRRLAFSLFRSRLVEAQIARNRIACGRQPLPQKGSPRSKSLRVPHAWSGGKATWFSASSSATIAAGSR